MGTSPEDPTGLNGGLRERHATPAFSTQGNFENRTDRADGVVPEKEKKTFGRTPDGTGETILTPG
jgi:hypothetical protein